MPFVCTFWMSPGFLAGLLGTLGVPLDALLDVPGRTSQTCNGTNLRRYAQGLAGSLKIVKNGAQDHQLANISLMVSPRKYHLESICHEASVSGHMANLRKSFRQRWTSRCTIATFICLFSSSLYLGAVPSLKTYSPVTRQQ